MIFASNVQQQYVVNNLHKLKCSSSDIKKVKETSKKLIFKIYLTHDIPNTSTCKSK